MISENLERTCWVFSFLMFKVQQMSVLNLSTLRNPKVFGLRTFMRILVSVKMGKSGVLFLFFWALMKF